MGHLVWEQLPYLPYGDDLASLRAVVGPDAPDAVLSALLEEHGSVQEAAAAYLGSISPSSLPLPLPLRSPARFRSRPRRVAASARRPCPVSSGPRVRTLARTLALALTPPPASHAVESAAHEYVGRRVSGAKGDGVVVDAVADGAAASCVVRYGADGSFVHHPV